MAEFYCLRVEGMRGRVVESLSIPRAIRDPIRYGLPLSMEEPLAFEADVPRPLYRVPMLRSSVGVPVFSAKAVETLHEVGAREFRAYPLRFKSAEDDDMEDYCVFHNLAQFDLVDERNSEIDWYVRDSAQNLKRARKVRKLATRPTEEAPLIFQDNISLRGLLFCRSSVKEALMSRFNKREMSNVMFIDFIGADLERFNKLL